MPGYVRTPQNGGGRNSISDIYQLTLSENDAGATVARIEGEIDMASAPAIGATVGTAIDRGPTVLDMTDVEFIDSAGIRMLVELARRAGPEPSPLPLVAPPGSIVRRMVELTGIEELFTIESESPT
jgi:anti-sigma B factor antagonist